MWGPPCEGRFLLWFPDHDFEKSDYQHVYIFLKTTNMSPHHDLSDPQHPRTLWLKPCIVSYKAFRCYIEQPKLHKTRSKPANSSPHPLSCERSTPIAHFKLWNWVSKIEHFNILQYYCYSNQIYVVYTSVEAICGPVCSYSNKIGIQNTIAWSL